MNMPKKDIWWRKFYKYIWAAFTYRHNVHVPCFGLAIDFQLKPTICLDLRMKILRNSVFMSIGTRFKPVNPISTPIPVQKAKPNPEGYAPKAPEE